MGYRNRSGRSSRGGYKKNYGLPGVVYILANPGLRHGWWKIGCSTRSGAHRANDLNVDATTGTPGIFECVFECRTLDCGLAEERVFSVLAEARRGKWGQEYFEVEAAVAEETIQIVCRQVDDETKPPAPPPAPPPKPVLPLTVPLPVLAKSPQIPAAQPQLKPQINTATNMLSTKRNDQPDRYCGHCRTNVIPKHRFLWLKNCPNCGHAL